jgi:hypothetical protein
MLLGIRHFHGVSFTVYGKGILNSGIQLTKLLNLHRDTAYYLLHLQPPFSIGRQLRLVFNLSHHGTQNLVSLRVERVHSMIIN